MKEENRRGDRTILNIVLLILSQVVMIGMNILVNVWAMMGEEVTDETQANVARTVYWIVLIAAWCNYDTTVTMIANVGLIEKRRRWLVAYDVSTIIMMTVIIILAYMNMYNVRPEYIPILRSVFMFTVGLFVCELIVMKAIAKHKENLEETEEWD